MAIGLSMQMMRKYVREAYPSAKWRARVDKMSDNQVFAVYSRLVLGGKK